MGLGLAAIGGIPIGATYGSDKVLVPGTHLLIAGTGIILGTWWSDVYAAAGGERWRGAPRDLAALEVGLSSTWQHDGFRGDRLYATPEVAVRAGRWSVSASAFATSDGLETGGRVDGAARLWGRRGDRSTARAAHNDTYVEARAAAQVLHQDDLGLTLGTIELGLRGRLDLARVDRHLRGVFFELDEGLGLELADYAPGPVDTRAILLSRFAWGLYLPCGRGEVSAFYDHRRDHRAGGLPAGRAAGFFGSVGADLDLRVGGGWGVAGRLEIGSSWLTTLGVRKELR